MSENTSEKGFFRGAWDGLCEWFNNREPGVCGFSKKIGEGLLWMPAIGIATVAALCELIYSAPKVAALIVEVGVSEFSDRSKGKAARFIMKGLVAAGAVAAGFFGSWFVCGWLAINALAI